MQKPENMPGVRVQLCPEVQRLEVVVSFTQLASHSPMTSRLARGFPPWWGQSKSHGHIHHMRIGRVSLLWQWKWGILCMSLHYNLIYHVYSKSSTLVVDPRARRRVICSCIKSFLSLLYIGHWRCTRDTRSFKKKEDKVHPRQKPTPHPAISDQPWGQWHIPFQSLVKKEKAKAWT
jgi:hypothetical protein